MSNADTIHLIQRLRGQPGDASLAAQRIEDLLESNNRLQSEIARLRADAKRVTRQRDEAVAQISAVTDVVCSNIHHDRTCSLEAQGYSEVECAEIVAREMMGKQIMDARHKARVAAIDAAREVGDE